MGEDDWLEAAYEDPVGFLNEPDTDHFNEDDIDDDEEN